MAMVTPVVAAVAMPVSFLMVIGNACKNQRFRQKKDQRKERTKMEVIYGLIPGMILLGLVMLGILFWAVRSGQYDDLEGSANRILMDDDDPLLPREKRGPKKVRDDEP